MYVFILFLIAQEVKEFVVKDIDFHGNRTFSDKKLKKVIHTTRREIYDEFQANMDKKRLANFYKNHGFKDIKITKLDKNIVDFERRLIKCDIYIEEGLRTYIREIQIEGNEVFSDQKLARIIKLKAENPLDEERIFVAKWAITDLYADYGYPYAEVEHKVDDSLSYEVTLCFQIREHQFVRFGGIRITGLESVRIGIIRREIQFKKGDFYSPRKLHTAQARIYGTDLFEEVSFELNGMKSKKDTVDVVFSVKEKLPRWVVFGGGYGSPNRAWFDIGWGHANLWNNGQNLGMLGKYELNPFKIEELQKVEVNITYREPYFLDTHFKAEFAPFYKFYIQDSIFAEKLAYQLTHIGAQGRIGRYIGKYTQAFFIYNYERIDSKGELEEPGGVVNSAIFSISYDTRDDIFYPRIGGIQSFSYEYAGLGGDLKFNKFIFNFSLNIRFLRNVIATRIKFGGILKEAPLERKFALGGVNTIRGYPDMIYIPEEWKDWIGLMNIEFRIPVWKKFSLAYFMDTGNIWEKKEDVTTKGMKLGAGFGLRYCTPIGPLRIDYGYRILETDLGNGRVYFGIGYMF